MIVRPHDDQLLLITQPDHARLAAEIIAAFQREPALLGPARDAVLLACAEHDNGWAEVDAAPTVDPETGRPFDFISGPLDVKLDVWARGIRRAARASARAGALVAEHALTVYAYRREQPSWKPFFDAVQSLRDGLLEEIGAQQGEARAQFDAEYRCVRLGDSLSLQYCNKWHEPQDTFEYTASLDSSDTLMIAPDPFAGATVSLTAHGRLIPARVYTSDDDLRVQLADAPLVAITGIACGGTHDRATLARGTACHNDRSG